MGQNLLVHTYESLFARRDVPVGQVLLTAGDILDDRQRYVNLRNTFRELFRLGAVPVINENDSVGVVELKRRLGDNDMLAAYVANLVQAQLLVILSDVEGLYRRYRNGRGEGLIHEATHDDDMTGVVGRGASRLGRGGMVTKVRAAELLMACGEKFAYVDILQNPEIRANLPKYANWPTFPQLWVNGELVGGSDILAEMFEKGELQTLVKDAAAKANA